jgi:hypothetical protein
MTTVLAPIHLGDFFVATAELRVIVQGISESLRANGSAITLQQALDHYSQLQAWYSGLPSAFRPDQIALPHELVLQ